MKVQMMGLMLNLCVSFLAHATAKDVLNVKVTGISVYPIIGATHIRVDPLPDLAGLTCTSPYWLVLDNNAKAYDATL
jgi:hypothetical protein